MVGSISFLVFRALLLPRFLCSVPWFVLSQPFGLVVVLPKEKKGKIEVRNKEIEVNPRQGSLRARCSVPWFYFDFCVPYLGFAL